MLVYTLKGWIQRFWRSQKGAGHYIFQPLTHPMPLYPPTRFASPWDYADAKSNAKNDYRSSRLIYIVAPTQRSGTNFLGYLLNLHRDVALPKGDNLPDEHFFLSYTTSLRTYCEQTVATWTKWVDGGEPALQQHAQRMMGHLGDGLVDYMSQFIDPNQRLLLKTPDAGNLADFVHLFPSAKLLLLIRDGRDTVHSFTKSWGGEVIFSKMCRRWAHRAETIIRFMDRAKRHGQSDDYLLLRYDQLHTDAEAQMKRILDFAGLAPDGYDWQGMSRAPVLGSSTFRGQQEGVNWEPVKKNPNFQPTGQWKSWSQRKRRIFKKYAGSQLTALGFADSDW